MRRWFAIAAVCCIGLPFTSQAAEKQSLDQRGRQRCATAPNCDRAPTPSTVVNASGDAQSPEHSAGAADPKHEGGWWEKLWSDPVATFTGALFLATAALIVTGVAQWLETRKTAKRQLRAYVGVSRGFFRRTTYNNLVAEIEIKNSGVTFAKKLRIQWEYRMEGLPGPGASQEFDGGVLMPGLIWSLHLELPAGIPTMAAIDRGDAFPRIDGRIDYVDAFDEARWTTFQYASGRAAKDGWDVRAVNDDEHRNDAT